jgi:hypothetical protein
MLTFVDASIKIGIGDRVYLKHCVAGEPGVVTKIHGNRAHVIWPDLPEITEPISHSMDNLVVDEGFMARSHVDFETAAA